MEGLYVVYASRGLKDMDDDKPDPFHVDHADGVQLSLEINGQRKKDPCGLVLI